MEARGVLQHRLSTLESLLEGGQASLTGGSGELRAQLADTWREEAALIRRLLEESQGGEVRATIQLWRARTERFVASSNGAVDGWTDAKGQRWHAERVLALLDELQLRLDQWQSDATTDAAPPVAPA